MDGVRIRQNIMGGLTAAVVALPLALAFGVSSGAGAAAGLYGSIITGLFAALLGGTATQITGPTGPMTVVMTVVITGFIGAYGVEAGLALSFTVVMLAGALQVLFGMLRWGNYINLVPYPVISAFMSGIGFLIIILQFPNLFGLSSEGETAIHIVENISVFLKQADDSVLLLGLAVFLGTYAIPKKIAKVIPTSLLVLVMGTFFGWYFFEPDQLKVIGEIPTALPSLQWPVFMGEELVLVVEYAIVLAALGSIESLLTSVVADNITKTSHDSNKELRGQGIANILAGFFGALPGAGASMRTMINIRSGGDHKLSGVIHALFLLAMVLGLGSMVSVIPHVVLSGLLLRVGMDIIDWHFISHLHYLRPMKAVLVVVIMLMTVFVDLLTAVGFGLFVFSLLAVKEFADVQIENMKVLGKNEVEKLTLSKKELSLFKELDERAQYIHLSGPMSFGAVREMSQLLGQDAPLKIIDLMDVNIIDVSSVMVLAEMADEAKESGHPVLFIIPERLHKLKALQAVNFIRKLSKKWKFSDRIAALQAALKLLRSLS